MEGRPVEQRHVLGLGGSRRQRLGRQSAPPDPEGHALAGDGKQAIGDALDGDDRRRSDAQEPLELVPRGLHQGRGQDGRAELVVERAQLLAQRRLGVSPVPRRDAAGAHQVPDERGVAGRAVGRVHRQRIVQFGSRTEV